MQNSRYNWRLKLLLFIKADHFFTTKKDGTVEIVTKSNHKVFKPNQRDFKIAKFNINDITVTQCSNFEKVASGFIPNQGRTLHTYYSYCRPTKDTIQIHHKVKVDNESSFANNDGSYHGVFNIKTCEDISEKYKNDSKLGRGECGEEKYTCDNGSIKRKNIKINKTGGKVYRWTCNAGDTSRWCTAPMSVGATTNTINSSSTNNSITGNGPHLITKKADKITQNSVTLIADIKVKNQSGFIFYIYFCTM